MANVWENTIKVDADGNATVDGNLTVNGTTTTIDTVNLTVEDKLIELAHGTTGTPSGDAGVIIERGSSTNAAIIWDESEDAWVACTTSATGGSSGDLTLTPGTLAAGSIGIGTTSPSSSLEIQGSSGDLAIEIDNNVTNSANLKIVSGAGNSRVDFEVDGSNHITLKGQKVSILGTNPTAVLDVTGDGKFSTGLTVTGTTTLEDTVLSEGKSLSISTPLLPTTDHTATGLTAEMLDSGAGIAAFQTVSISTTNTKVIVSDSNNAATMPVIGIAPAAISTDATGTILLQGFIRDDTWGWTAGSILYASETAGAMTHTAPTTSGAFVQALGVALSADVVYFNPALTLVEVD